MSFHWFDIAAGLFLLACIVYSGLRGFVKDLFSVLAWVFGYLGSIHLHPYLTPFTKQVIKTSLIADLVTFFILFAFIYIFVRLLGVFSQKKLGLEHLPAEINHGAGAILGVAKWVFFLAIFLSPLGHFPDLEKDLSTNSIAAALIINTTTQMTFPDASLPEAAKSIVEKSRGIVSKIESAPEDADKTDDNGLEDVMISSPGKLEGVVDSSEPQVRIKEVEPIQKTKGKPKGAEHEVGEDLKKMDDFVGSFDG